LTYTDFLLSAAVIAPILGTTPERGVGQAILKSIQATRRFVRTNTNLGIVLLLAPLAAVPRAVELRTGIVDILNQLEVNDSKAVFTAIRTVNPGGLGESSEQDVHNEPSLPLKAIMALAADRDIVARQYARDYEDIFGLGLVALREGLAAGGALEPAIILCHLRLLATWPDTHIQRRCGPTIADEARRQASQVLQYGWPHEDAGRRAFAEFDAWLRADGHRRNPGATADLVTASLFVALRDGIIQFPCQFS
jgi:triphosphoribosyl-dephospho-CoA synthase